MLTKVTCLHIPKKHNWFLAFGSPVKTEFHHSQKSGAKLSSHYFEPGQIFGLSIQRLNRHGIVNWNTYVLLAAGPEAKKIHEIGPAVSPGAECLVAFPGKNKSRLAKEYFSFFKECGLSLENNEEIHRRAAHYLMVGVLPERLIQSCMSGGAYGRRG